MNEIQQYKSLLAQYNMTFNDLVDLCPRDQQAREYAKRMAKSIASHPKIVIHLQNIHQELKEYEPPIDQRYHRYVIALVILYSGEFKHLYRYLNQD
ncbi:hypothetical protein [Caldalkalibacillus salinus]|uniref:hypothetical protein n=1 Tax=Caldalkalibacillus salinus TaxID=2803787 RepID=UPI0019243A3D|nr:hypothetical protein [Caldalkalibacillus salinus]